MPTPTGHTSAVRASNVIGATVYNNAGDRIGFAWAVATGALEQPVIASAAANEAATILLDRVTGASRFCKEYPCGPVLSGQRTLNVSWGGDRSKWGAAPEI